MTVMLWRKAFDAGLTSSLPDYAELLRTTAYLDVLETWKGSPKSSVRVTVDYDPCSSFLFPVGDVLVVFLVNDSSGNWVPVTWNALRRSSELPELRQEVLKDAVVQTGPKGPA
jgi:hypothetical protein